MPSPAWAVADADVVVVAVKPGDVPAALEACATSLPEGALVLSIAAGVTIATLEAAVAAAGRSCARCRTPPRSSAGARRRSRRARTRAEHDLELAERLLGAVGIVVRVPEAQLDAVTGLSGSGPAYVFLVAEALIEAGVLVGLPRPTADALVRQTLLGSATLLAESGESPEALRAAVTSPGGTTAAGSAGARGARRAGRVPRRGGSAPTGGRASSAA